MAALFHLRFLYGSRLNAFRLNYLRPLLRVCTLAALGLTGPMESKATNMAAKAYNKVCINRAPLMPIHDINWLSFLGVGLIMLLPVACSRSRPVLAMHLFLSIVTLTLGLSLLTTANTPPYECYTQAGSYEDHVSGLFEFDMWRTLTLVALYVSLFVDWFIWAAKRVFSEVA